MADPVWEELSRILRTQCALQVPPPGARGRGAPAGAGGGLGRRAAGARPRPADPGAGAARGRRPDLDGGGAPVRPRGGGGLLPGALADPLSGDRDVPDGAGPGVGGARLRRLRPADHRGGDSARPLPPPADRAEAFRRAALTAEPERGPPDRGRWSPISCATASGAPTWSTRWGTSPSAAASWTSSRRARRPRSGSTSSATPSSRSAGSIPSRSARRTPSIRSASCRSPSSRSAPTRRTASPTSSPAARTADPDWGPEAAEMLESLRTRGEFPGWENYLPLLAGETVSLPEVLGDPLVLRRRSAGPGGRGGPPRRAAAGGLRGAPRARPARRAPRDAGGAGEPGAGARWRRPSCGCGDLVAGGGGTARPAGADFRGTLTDLFHGQLPRFPQEVATARSRGERCIVVVSPGPPAADRGAARRARGAARQGAASSWCRGRSAAASGCRRRAWWSTASSSSWRRRSSSAGRRARASGRSCRACATSRWGTSWSTSTTASASSWRCARWGAAATAWAALPPAVRDLRGERRGGSRPR